MLNIVADENMPGLDEHFGDIGVIQRVAGRHLGRDQLVNADILLVRSVTKVNEALLRGTPVRFVGTATIGTDHVDLDYLRSANIAFSSAPGSNANSVAEYVVASLLAVLDDSALQRLACAGVIGLGNVGSAVARKLQSLGLTVRAYDPFLSDSPLLGDLDSALSSDIVCVHTPLTLEGPYPTRDMFNVQQLADSLPRGAVLLNAGRGEVIGNACWHALLDRRPDIHAVIDVWQGEPAADPLLIQRAALASPHIAGYSFDGKLAATAMLRTALLRSLAEPLYGEIPAVSNAADSNKSVCVRLSQTEGWQALREAVFNAYDPRVDDRAMRRLLAHDPEAMAQAFDQLRKQYRQRREFNHYRVAGSADPRLRALGFAVEGE